MRADLPAEDIVHSHHLVEGLSQMRVASRTVGRVGYGTGEDWLLELQAFQTTWRQLTQLLTSHFAAGK